MSPLSSFLVLGLNMMRNVGGFNDYLFMSGSALRVLHCKSDGKHEIRNKSKVAGRS